MDLNRHSELDVLVIALNEKLRSITKSFKPQILSKYKNDPLINKLFDLYEYDDVLNKNDFEQFLDSMNIIGDYRRKLLLTFDAGQSLTQAGIDIVYRQIQTMVAQIVLESAASSNNPFDAVNMIKSVNFDSELSADTKFIKRYKLDEVDVDHIFDDFKNPIPSFMKTINQCFVTGGYLQHQLINVIAPPSCGKSLFLMNEAVNFLDQGLHVCYCALGDLTEADFMSRMTAIKSGDTIDDVVKNLKVSWAKFKNSLGDKIKNLELQYIEPNTVTMGQLYSFLDTSGIKKSADVIILDYDSNFKSDNELYDKGNEIYSIASKLSREVKLVFIAAQPKIQYYDQEIIPQEGASESARKSQIVDLMITIGRNPNSVNPIGYINLAKTRRGGKRFQFPYTLNPNGRFIEVPLKIYHTLAKETELVRVDMPSSDDDLRNLV